MRTATAPDPAALDGPRLPPEARAFVEAIGARDRELRAHCGAVARYAVVVARWIGVEPRARADLPSASLLHDVGKLAISERILSKPGPLTPAERAAVRAHTRIGARLVARVPALRGIAPAILHHHERWDGLGYPERLGGEEIPVEARIIGVVDAFAAMLADRPYRRARSFEEACEELERCAGTQFDPTIVRVFVAVVRGDDRRGAASAGLRRPGRP